MGFLKRWWVPLHCHELLRMWKVFKSFQNVNAIQRQGEVSLWGPSRGVKNVMGSSVLNALFVQGFKSDLSSSFWARAKWVSRDMCVCTVYMQSKKLPDNNKNFLKMQRVWHKNSMTINVSKHKSKELKTTKVTSVKPFNHNQSGQQQQQGCFTQPTK